MVIKRFFVILFSLFLLGSICFANDYTRIEEIISCGRYIITPEFYIEVWDYDTNKTSCWIPCDRLIVTPRGYLINIDREETARIVDIALRKNTGLYDDIDKEVKDK